MAKDVEKIKEEEEVETAEAVEETKPKKERKKWSRKKKATAIGGALLAAALGLTAKLLSDKSYKRGVTDTTEYYERNPIEKPVYLPMAETTYSETEMTETANTDEF